MPAQLKTDEIVIRGPRQYVDEALVKLRRNRQIRAGRILIEYTDKPPAKQRDT